MLANILTIATSIISSVFLSWIALRGEISIVKNVRLRDRYWDYLENLIKYHSNGKDKEQLKRQTYNLCLFAKNDKIRDLAKELLDKKTIENNDIEEIISLMRKDLGL